MEDIFKTESRLRKRLLEAAKNYKRETIRDIIDFFGIALKSYFFPIDENFEEAARFKIMVIEKNKEENIKKLKVANDIVKEYNLFPGDIFTNPEDTRQSILDYDYYVSPRTKTQYEKEEAEARAGINGKMPMDFK